MNWLRRLSFHPAIIRLTHWEYWPFHLVYFPIYIVWLGFCFRARSFFFFAAANPCIRNGGFLNESKKDLAALIPADLQPRTLFFSLPVNVDVVMAAVQSGGLQFPLIGKPDIGGRGRGVKALADEEDLRQYVRGAVLDFHVQEFVAYANELGIFYHRLPGEECGRISGIVLKSFLSVTGDGWLTVRQLLSRNQRAILQLPALEQTQAALLDRIPAMDETLVVVPYGNHARGALFLDGSGRINEKLTEAIDRICRRIPGFYFGRLDIRYNSWEALEKGEELVLIEVNGAGSEPTHIYDPQHSIFFAWKEIIRHWNILYHISRANHRRGVPYLNLTEGIAMFRENKLNEQKLAAMPQ